MGTQAPAETFSLGEEETAERVSPDPPPLPAENPVEAEPVEPADLAKAPSSSVAGAVCAESCFLCPSMSSSCA